MPITDSRSLSASSATRLPARRLLGRRGLSFARGVHVITLTSRRNRYDAGVARDARCAGPVSHGAKQRRRTGGGYRRSFVRFRYVAHSIRAGATRTGRSSP
ncbi:hypothetical protein MTO96_015081 [Rhipicephalus appendiculatus]